MKKSQFDEKYFDRYYGKQPVRSTSEVAHLATAVHEMVSWWGGTITSFLEVGAGPGHWRDWYRTFHPNVRVLSTDVSEHACREYGHERRDIAHWAPQRQYDLVVCMDVLQYLDDTSAARALRNLSSATRTCLYFDALTSFDARYTVDRATTDLDAHLRPGEWYQRHLSRSFIRVGGGIWVKKTSDLVLHELERV